MHILKTKESLKLSRAIGDRILISALAIMMGFFSGAGCWYFSMAVKPPETMVEAIFVYSLRDAFWGVFILCWMALLWGIAAPQWIEKLLERHALKAYGAVLLTIPVVLIGLWLMRNFSL